MSSSISRKDIVINAKSLMGEKNYGSALNNWQYLKKNQEGFDAEATYNSGLCFQNMKDNASAIEQYKCVITTMSKDKNLMDKVIFIETVYALGVIEKECGRYTLAVDAFESFLQFVSDHQMSIPDKTIEIVETQIKECDTIINKNINKAKKGEVKKTDYKSNDISKKNSKSIKNHNNRPVKDIPKDEQKQEVEKMWQKMEQNKMQIPELSQWYIIECEWFNHWKQWSGFSPSQPTPDESATTEDETQVDQSKGGIEVEVEQPGTIFNNSIIEDSEISLVRKEVILKDNLTEEQDYIILNQEIWYFFKSIYGGVEIERRATKNIDKEEDAEFAECIIEVNLVKIYVFEVPRENKRDYYEVFLASRNWSMSDVKRRICAASQLTEDIRIWKLEKPENLDKFYVELEHEWKKYTTLRVNGELFKDLDVLVKDSNFSRDDFLMIEYKIRTSNSNGFAFVEVEKKDIQDTLNEKASRVLENNEELKEALLNPKTLEFIKTKLSLVSNDESVEGACGLSNLGNTCFMNSALQCMSHSIELSKYFCFRIHESEVNHHNVLGSKGRVAEAYGDLINEMWIGNKRKTAPFEIKKSIGSVVAQFRGYNQQDSHEFLHYLIDILNEDLNRVKEKPYVEIADSEGRDDSIVSSEHWNAFSKRNDSIMVDLFYGQLKSHLVCLE